MIKSRWTESRFLCPEHSIPMVYTQTRRFATCTKWGCEEFVETGEYVPLREPLPDQESIMDCQFQCEKKASYDFKTRSGGWAFGCLAHWIEFRSTKEVTLSTANRVIGANIPDRPPGAVQDTMFVRARPGAPTQPAVRQGKMLQHTKTMRRQEPIGFQNLDAAPQQKIPTPGCRLDIIIQLARRPEGTTVEEMNKAIGWPDHDANRLMRWSNRERGWGWTMDAEGRIRVLPG